MKKPLVLLFSAALFLGCAEEQKKEPMSLSYPESKKVDTIDTYFGEEVPDPYRWLEDDMSDETAAWVKAQNEVTFSYLEEIPYRDSLNERMAALWNYEKIGAPFKEGEHTYFYKNDGLQDHNVLYRKTTDGEEVFLDPNTFSEDGTTSLDEIEFSKSGKLAAYSISEGGSDWRKIIIINTETKEQIGDTLVDVKFTELSWKGEEGLFYSTYKKPEGSQLSAKTDTHLLFYHQLNTPQKEDKVVFGDTEKQKSRYVSGKVSRDSEFLFISRAVSTSGNELYLMDLKKENNSLTPVITGFDSTSSVFDNDGTTLYIETNLDAPNKRIVSVDAADPGTENWKDLIPEREYVLSPSKGGGYIFASYMADALSKVYQYDYEGKEIREIELPGPGTTSGFKGKRNAEEIYFSFSNYNTPSSIYKLDPENGETSLHWAPEIDFNVDEYESNQVFYNSKDGTKIPMLITHKKGIDLNGKNPTMLYGYGGFNISLTPSFSVTNAIWMEQGGILAVPNLRGGGEYGRKWHDAGTKQNKQNVFDDFIAAAEYLIDKKYTSSDYLAVRGASNGGLLVGAVVNQRPELFRVGIPQVGVLDMLRYHTFTSGAGWAYDYGTSEDSKEMFAYLRGYSPLHSIKEGKNYPAILVTTADHDDRVVPAHSFKYAAELQSKDTGERPKIIRIDTKAGHGAGMSVSKTIALYSDIIGFSLYNMGVESLEKE